MLKLPPFQQAKQNTHNQASNKILQSAQGGMAAFVFMFLYLLLPNSATSKCPESFQCGHRFSLEFPFSQDPQCGMFTVTGCNNTHEFPTVRLGEYPLCQIIDKISTNKFKILDVHLSDSLKEGKCIPRLDLLQSPSISFAVASNLTPLYSCTNQTSDERIQNHFKNYSSFYDADCGPSTVYYLNQTAVSPPPEQRNIPADCGPSALYYIDQTAMSPPPEQRHIPADCGVFCLPIDYNRSNTSGLLERLTPEYTLEWNISQACNDCNHGGGQCLLYSRNGSYCRKGKKDLKKLILAICIPGAVVLLGLLVGYIIWQRNRKLGRSYLLQSSPSSDPSSKSFNEEDRFNFGIPIFSYTELVEATSNFDSSEELGDGGFGTVYHGKLRDGREVAIKRLYEHNYRRVEQFLNEIKILTSLRHPNLVSLYGCTSRRSRELLLVYEYIANGTVADHLHGERAKEAPLTWPVRMIIARETAGALAYLHKSDIIHRDVKTNNILLDNNFSVKVADFGLSRLFPLDVTHISTAPQGTPGYVDPEYHQCYQLTDKSDVYSFGVVLIELISSMPAVDINRHKHEINLANFAVNMIQKCAFDELIDPSTGYNSDPEVTRMTTSVAELAFRCLQLEKDMRPQMEEVVMCLKDIDDGHDYNSEQIKEGNANHSFGKIHPSPETDEAVLLKSKTNESSPTTVTDGWISCSSTAASSIGCSIG